MSKLIVLSGVPGSGKSYFSNLFIKMKKSHVYVISSDKLRQVVLGDQRDLSNEPLIWDIFYRLSEVYSHDKDALVILDACNVKEKYRTESITKLIPLFDEISLVMFKLDRSIVSKQNIDRDNPVPQHVLDMFLNEFEDVGENDRKIYKHIYVIKDISNIPMIVDRIIQE